MLLTSALQSNCSSALVSSLENGLEKNMCDVCFNYTKSKNLKMIQTQLFSLVEVPDRKSISPDRIIERTKWCPIFKITRSGNMNDKFDVDINLMRALSGWAAVLEPSPYPSPNSANNPSPLMLESLSPSWLLPNSTVCRPFENNSLDNTWLCLEIKMIFLLLCSFCCQSIWTFSHFFYQLNKIGWKPIKMYHQWAKMLSSKVLWRNLLTLNSSNWTFFFQKISNSFRYDTNRYPILLLLIAEFPDFVIIYVQFPLKLVNFCMFLRYFYSRLSSLVSLLSSVIILQLKQFFIWLNKGKLRTGLKFLRRAFETVCSLFVWWFS